MRFVRFKYVREKYEAGAVLVRRETLECVAVDDAAAYILLATWQRQGRGVWVYFPNPLSIEPMTQEESDGYYLPHPDSLKPMPYDLMENLRRAPDHDSRNLGETTDVAPSI